MDQMDGGGVVGHHHSDDHQQTKINGQGQQLQQQQQQQHMSLGYDETLESGYSTPNSRNRRVIREIIV